MDYDREKGCRNQLNTEPNSRILIGIPPIPLVCAILPWNNHPVNFISLAFFLPGTYCLSLIKIFCSIFQSFPCSLLGGLVIFGILENLDFATLNAKNTVKSMDLQSNRVLTTPLLHHFFGKSLE